MDSVLSTYAYPPLRMLSKSCICPTIARNLREVLDAIFAVPDSGVATFYLANPSYEDRAIGDKWGFKVDYFDGGSPDSTRGRIPRHLQGIRPLFFELTTKRLTSRTRLPPPAFRRPSAVPHSPGWP